MSLTTTNDKDFTTDVLESKVPVLVDFFATWCGPCQSQTPVLEKLTEKLGAKAKILKVDVDQNPETAQKFGIMSIPTLKLFKDGQEKQSFVGLTREDVLESAINNLL
jgi:thioredoxin 1